MIPAGEKIEVGKIYTNGEQEVEVLFVGDQVVVIRREGMEWMWGRTAFRSNFTLVVPKLTTKKWCIIYVDVQGGKERVTTFDDKEYADNYIWSMKKHFLRLAGPFEVEFSAPERRI